LEKLNRLEEKNKEDKEKLNFINKVADGVKQSDEKAIFLMDLIKNYSKKVPRWSETSTQLCTIWKFCSPKGYEHCRNHIAKLPSKTTISRYVGDFHGSNELIERRLKAEISKLTVPIERSIIIDDMSIKEKMSYSRSEDVIHGLENTQAQLIGEKPKLANKMLCYVLHGLSTKYTIPVGYFFHETMNTEKFHSLTMKVLNLVTNKSFIVLRMVTDNHASNVALFKKLSNGTMQNYIPHPVLDNVPLFLNFDFCHAIKNSRNLFLDHDMCSSAGVISSEYLKNCIIFKKEWL
jgi:hypothetical protein